MKTKTNKRIVSLSVLPGQPTDGSGIVCVHLFVPDDKGPFVEEYVLAIEEVESADGTMITRPTTKPVRGRLACDNKKTRQVAPKEVKGTTYITMRTDDARAATCLNCKNTEVYKELMTKLATI